MRKTICLIIGICSLCFAVMLQGGEILINNDDGAPAYFETGLWKTSSYTGYQGGTYRFTDDFEEYSTATWTPEIIEPGLYQVSAIFLGSPNRASEVPYTIVHGNGVEQVWSSQYRSSTQMTEISLGSYFFETGTEGSVMLSNDGSVGAYIADCIRFVKQDTINLAFTDLSFSPRFPGRDDDVDISIRITPYQLVQDVYAHYTVYPEGTVYTLTAQHAGDGYFEAQIPAQSSQSVVMLYFSATDIEDGIHESSQVSYQVDGGEYRSLWADTWGRSIRSPAEVEELVATCRANNINTMMVEVRKIGDAYYNSSIEPRATNITGGAGFDPLAYLLELAHDTSDGKPYIHVHGWFVMQRIDTTGSNMQSHPDHVLNRHPEYLMYSDTGGTVASNSYYLDPGHPGSVEWNIDVILDCMENYPIDGVNLDYIRYPGQSWGYNPVSVARFQEAYGRSDIPDYDDPEWSDWRRLLVTNHVKKLYVKMMKMDPSVILTACTVNWGYEYTEETFPDSRAYYDVFQDWVGWLKEGIIDYNAFMNYTRSIHLDRYKRWTDLSLAVDGIRGSIIGIGAYLHDSVADSMEKLEYAREQGAAGLNIYDWYSEVNANTQGETRSDFYNELRTQLFPEWVDPPVSAWKEYPTKGVVEGTITYNGDLVDFCSVVLNHDTNTMIYSDGTGWYGMLEIPVGNHILTFNRDGYPVRTVEITIEEGGQIKTRNIELSEPGFLDYDAEAVSYSLQEVLLVNTPYTLELTMKNTGNAPWLVSQSTYLGAVGDHDFLAPSENWRVGMQDDVMPGESYTFTVELYPSEQGTFTTSWRMLKEWYFWFGEEFSTQVEVEDPLEIMDWTLFK